MTLRTKCELRKLTSLIYDRQQRSQINFHAANAMTHPPQRLNVH